MIIKQRSGGTASRVLDEKFVQRGVSRKSLLVNRSDRPRASDSPNLTSPSPSASNIVLRSCSRRDRRENCARVSVADGRTI